MNYDPGVKDPDERIIIVGGPRTGKSTLARQLRHAGLPTFCGDPRSLVKEPEETVSYLPEELDWSAGSQYVADSWFDTNGPWVAEGQIMARALRKFVKESSKVPADRILVLTDHHPFAVVTTGQAAMHKAVMTVWRDIAHHFEKITEYPVLAWS